MREILFRGKDIADNWHYGDLEYITDDFVKIVNHRMNEYGKKVEIDTVGQFTGLLDKNRKKIFEGDIGRYQQTDGARQNNKPIICIGKVIYNAKTASFAVESKDEKEVKYFDYFPVKDFEIIGNIHDNPELLEVKK